jgi:hypothetical protein
MMRQHASPFAGQSAKQAMPAQDAANRKQDRKGVVVIDSGTKVKVLSTEEFSIGDEAHFLEVLSGPHAGLKGWMCIGYVSKAGSGD